MITIPISLLRERLQYYLRKAAKGERVRITSHGETLVDIVPASITVNEREEARARLREIAKTAIIGDVISPANAVEDWDVMREDADPFHGLK